MGSAIVTVIVNETNMRRERNRLIRNEIKERDLLRIRNRRLRELLGSF